MMGGNWTESISKAEPPWKWLRAALLIILLATVTRGVLNFRHTLAPGMDAAYYPMQTRWLFEHGELMDHPPPLIFWLDYSLTKAILWTTNNSLDEACMLATRLIDCAAHPWVALPILLLGRKWSQGRRDAFAICCAAAIIAVLSPPVMRMASDFQKNSLGLVWMSFAVWAFREALAEGGLLKWAMLSTLCFLSALTHIGAFGVTCVTLAGAGIGYLVLTRTLRVTRKKIIGAVSIISIGLSLLFLMFRLEPTWTQRLLTLPQRAATMVGPRIDVGPAVLSLLVYCALAFVVRAVWKKRDALPPCDAAIAIGCAAGLGVLVAPVLQGTWAMRFQLMTPLPAAMLLLFFGTHLCSERTLPKFRKASLVVASGLALLAPFFTQGPVVDRFAKKELIGFAPQVTKPTETLVIAPHGVEFWAGVTMHTPVASHWKIRQRDAYDRILIIEPTAQRQRGRAEPRRMRPTVGHGNRPERNEPRHDAFVVPGDAELLQRGQFFNLYEMPKTETPIDHAHGSLFAS
ncbi:MAG: hypothetical protein AAFX06_24320 [Planctomycetota bacterium]